MIKSITSFLFIVILTLQSINVKAQNSRFNAGIIAGINFAELEGSDITDYFGINTGIIGTLNLSKHTQLGVEFLFSQNGEYILPKYYPKIQYGEIRLNHIEIPIHIDWLINARQKDKSYDCRLNMGIAYTRLMGYKVKNSEKVDISNQIIYKDKDAFLLQAGATYHFTSKVALNIKASLPIRRQTLDWTLALRMVYMI